MHLTSERPIPEYQWTEQSTGVVRLEEWSAEAITEALRFLYRGSVELSSLELTQELWTLAGYLVLPHLEARLQAVLLGSLSMDTCTSLFCFASKFNNQPLLKRCETWMRYLHVKSRETAEEIMLLLSDPSAVLDTLTHQLQASTVPENSLTFHVCCSSLVMSFIMWDFTQPKPHPPLSYTDLRIGEPPSCSGRALHGRSGAEFCQGTGCFLNHKTHWS